MKTASVIRVGLLQLLRCSSGHSSPPPTPAPPFTFNLDQTVPCPHGSADYSIAVPLGSDKSLQATLNDYMPKFLESKLTELDCPGIAVIVTQGGRMIHESYAGSAKAHSQLALNSSTGTEIASITKTFTTTMLFMLRDAGRLGSLGLDTAVSDLMPEFSIQTPYPSGRGITLRALAMHLSGLPREAPHGETEAEILAALSKLTVLSPQFAEAHYSNLGLSLLGRALQRAANMTWEEYVETKILVPLGMLDSGNPPFRPEVLARMAEGVSGSGKVVQLPTHTTWGSPCGSMHSSPRDMVRWMNFHMDVGTAEEKAMFAKVLDPATRTEMRSTGFVLGDGLAGVSSAVFETAYIHGRRTASKLGVCPVHDCLHQLK
jgi:CubicO group peptidase (beta-lactamase class C family)